MRRSRGFTLVEILIVVIILGILAAIVIPQFTNATSDAKISSLKTTLSSMRQQVEFFKLQHNDMPPPDATAFMVVMTRPSTVGDTAGSTAAGTLGPYMSAIPVNPLNGYTTMGAAAGASKGWVYVMNSTAATTTNGNVTQYVYTLSATDTLATGTLTY